jgi:FkbM family methyltransferase
VNVNPADLLPRKGEPILTSARAIWREAGDRGGSEWAYAKTRVKKHLHDLAYPAYRAAREIVHRLVPAAETLPSLGWGPDEVLVATPFHTRLLCPTDDLSISPELALTGTHDQPSADLLRRLGPGMTFVDVGANVGFLTILGAARVGPRGNVIAYECNPELVEFVRRNVAMNRVGDRVRLIAKAAHRDDEERRLRVPRHLKGLGTLMHSEDEVDDDQEFPVPCERLDVGLAGLSYVDLLRIDVEGSEAAVLEGASGLLDSGKIGVIAMKYREGSFPRELQEEMEKQLTSLVQDRGASLYELAKARPVSLDEVLTVFDYPQLLIQLPGASIKS